MVEQHGLFTTAVDQFKEAMVQKGITPPPEIIGDGKIHHFSSSGRVGDNKGWYVFHDQDIPSGSFGDFRQYGTDSFPWVTSLDRDWTPTEKRDYQKKQADLRAKRKAETDQRRAEARIKAARIMAASTPPDDTHPYLVKKDVRAHGIALWQDPALSISTSKKTGEPFLQITSKDGTTQFGIGVDLEGKSEEDIYRAWKSILIIPMLDDSGETQSLQFISTNGDKKFLFGGKMQGCYFPIGTIENADTILIAEGYATAATIHEITNLPVVVAYNAGNLLPVAESIRAQYPSASIVLCADDDWKTKGNPGITKANEAAEAIGGKVIAPIFGDNRPDKATDFNDMAAHLGKVAVTDFFIVKLWKGVTA